MYLDGDIVPIYYSSVSVFVIIANICLFGVSNLFVCLLQLSVLNERLGEVSSTQAVPPSSALQHTLQRHQEILQDYTQEFRKTQANYRARREREDLLNTVRKDIE